jgi:KDO2-lipid IV(A) lauroyltransferase
LNNPLGQWVVYLLVRYISLCMEVLPYPAAKRVSRAVAWGLHLVDRKHRKIATRNLLMADPPVCTPEEVPAMVRRVYEHIALSLVEMLRLPNMLKRGGLGNFVNMKGFNQIDDAIDEGRGALVVIAHLGNWEIGGVASSMAGYPIHSLARPITNKYIDRYLNAFRTSAGQTIISKYNALRAMIQVVRENNMLVIQTDQDNRRTGVFPMFFGRPASTVRSPAVLALKYDFPIFPADCYREGDMHYMTIDDPILPADFRDEEDPITALTQAYTSKLEEFIRRHPEQWMWLHRRWKTTPEKAKRVRTSPVEEATPVS